ncbi:glycosyltransferase 87 family protein [Mycobacterium kiyosense]|uniref:glycosyltransferase 87 family protein n=2 Tax=Mycobacteriaceae TaxID=1762 RepID=UPI0022310414|nr:hypothetical protein [Mycobacterium kiyosense]
MSAVAAATSFVLTQYFSKDVITSLFYLRDDCRDDMVKGVGRHCFTDYADLVALMQQPDPWHHYFVSSTGVYSAAALMPFRLFALLGSWLGVPQLVLFGYLIALTMAVLTPAFWAARGARGLERLVIFVACGAAAIPALVDVDRGNSTGFVVPIMLVFLIALCRQRWGVVAVMVILAALVKPQFALLGVALLAARQWRLGGIAAVGGILSNLAAYLLLTPHDFPRTIVQTVDNMRGHNSGNLNQSLLLVSYNVSFGRGLLLIPDAIKNGAGDLHVGYLSGARSLIGYGVLVLIVGCLFALGRRVPPVMVGIALLATASLSPPLVYHYYLVFVLPVAALLIRDPDGPPGSGIFDRLATIEDGRRAVGICVSLAAALSIAQTPLPFSPIISAWTGRLDLVETTAALAPLLWLLACAAIVVSYARKPWSKSREDVSIPVSSQPVTANAS